MKFIIYILVVAIVLVFSSAIKCLVDSNGKDFLFGRSKCASCQKILKNYDLIPIFSFLYLRGCCRYCGNKIPKDIFLYELGALIFIISYDFVEKYLFFTSYVDVFLAIILYFLALEDIKTYEVNSILFYILIFLCGVKIFERGLDIEATLIFIVICHILYFFTRSGLGYGDIKIFCVLGSVLNIYEAIYLLCYTFIYAGIVAIVLFILKKVNRKTKMALVPYIVLAYITVILLREIMLW